MAVLLAMPSNGEGKAMIGNGKGKALFSSASFEGGSVISALSPAKGKHRKGGAKRIKAPHISVPNLLGTIKPR